MTSQEKTTKIWVGALVGQRRSWVLHSRLGWPSHMAWLVPTQRALLKLLWEEAENGRRSPEVSVLRILEGLLSESFSSQSLPTAPGRGSPTPGAECPSPSFSFFHRCHFQPAMDSAYEAYDSAPVDWIHGDFLQQDFASGLKEDTFTVYNII